MGGESSIPGLRAGAQPIYAIALSLALAGTCRRRDSATPLQPNENFCFGYPSPVTAECLGMPSASRRTGRKPNSSVDHRLLWRRERCRADLRNSLGQDHTRGSFCRRSRCRCPRRRQRNGRVALPNGPGNQANRCRRPSRREEGHRHHQGQRPGS